VTRHDLFPFSISAGFLLLVAALAFWLSSCDHGANIPIDPIDCVDSVTDECVPEVIEEFCAPECEVCLTRKQYAINLRYWYDKGVDSVVCEEPPPAECFVRETEKVCVQYRHGRCCKWEHVTTFEPIDCPDPEEVEVP